MVGICQMRVINCFEQLVIEGEAERGAVGLSGNRVRALPSDISLGQSMVGVTRIINFPGTVCANGEGIAISIIVLAERQACAHVGCVADVNLC